MINARSLKQPFHHEGTKDTKRASFVSFVALWLMPYQSSRQQRTFINEPRVHLHQIRAHRKFRANVLARKNATYSDEWKGKPHALAHLRQDRRRTLHQRHAGEAAGLG